VGDFIVIGNCEEGNQSVQQGGMTFSDKCGLQ